MERNLAKTDASESKDLLLALGGLALVVFGAGLILTHPFVRKQLGHNGIGGWVSAALPDLERYMRLRSM